MGYSNNLSAVTRVEKFLTLMVNAVDESLEWQTVDPNKLAYYIREGISASSFIYKNGTDDDEKLKEFSQLKSKFIIKIKENRVIAVLRSEMPVAVMSVKKIKSVYLPNVTTLTQVVGAVAKYIIEENKEQITIPNTNLSNEESVKLERYLSSKNLKVEVGENELVILRESST